MPLFPPLKKMKLTQGFGVNLVYPGFYKSLGIPSDRHNGWDLSAPTGTEVFACMDGEVQYAEGGQGYGNDFRIRSRELGLEAVYGHLNDAVIRSGTVRKGDLVAHSDNTGASTAPHLHFGIRSVFWRADGSGPYVDDYDNGYFGYVDPSVYFSPDPFALPVDSQYGRYVKGMTELQWYAANAYFWKVTGRLMTTREKNALVYGYWDLRTVLDPAMFETWTAMTKIEAQSRGIIK